MVEVKKAAEIGELSKAPWSSHLCCLKKPKGSKLGDHLDVHGSSKSAHTLGFLLPLLVSSFFKPLLKVNLLQHILKNHAWTPIVGK